MSTCIRLTRRTRTTQFIAQRHRGLEGLMVCLDDPLREIDRFGEPVMPHLGLTAATT
ncbi:MAG TPA: hypothetical protein VNT03_08460 [Baekduia sp.]|nr:hypothetical protein [Baekduia sp.]